MAPTALPAAQRRADRRPLVALLVALVAVALLCVWFRWARWLFAILAVIALLRSLGLVAAARSSMRDPDAPRPAPPAK